MFIGLSMSSSLANGYFAGFDLPESLKGARVFVVPCAISLERDENKVFDKMMNPDGTIRYHEPPLIIEKERERGEH